MIASLRRQPDVPDIRSEFRVVVIADQFGTEHVVLEHESYSVASQVEYGLNYLFGQRGALSGLGRAVIESGGETAEVAQNIYRRFRQGGLES
jgi:hypothetical protein